ncbi:MAG TPA: CDP-glucose 4,6-dehydratase [Thermoanaerobaculia bacterium]|nr:CDP-glucose 4,6-dehydratase [Thermoanaerobaculia bacterium]
MEALGVTPSFWRGKKVLVTGHTGFKGSWLSLWLQRLGAEVTGFALEPPTEPSLFVSARVAEGMKSMTGDVRAREAVEAVVSESRPEILFHLAAQSLVRRSYADPVETYATNVMGTVHVLEAARRTVNIRALVNVTSDKCYSNREWLWGYREHEPLGGTDPYSSSKACAELVSGAYRDSFFTADGSRGLPLALASARAGNGIGGGDWATDRLMPDVFRAFLEKRPALIRNPAAVRPWQHVLDMLNGYLVLAERLRNSGRDCAEAWNFGPYDEDVRPVQWIVERLGALWGEGAAWEIDRTSQPPEAKFLRVDSSKARARLGWRPRLRLDDALEWTVDWYRQHGRGADVRKITEEQIARFEEKGGER